MIKYTKASFASSIIFIAHPWQCSVCAAPDDATSNDKEDNKPEPWDVLRFDGWQRWPFAVSYGDSTCWICNYLWLLLYIHARVVLGFWKFAAASNHPCVLIRDPIAFVWHFKQDWLEMQLGFSWDFVICFCSQLYIVAGKTMHKVSQLYISQISMHKWADMTLDGAASCTEFPRHPVARGCFRVSSGLCSCHYIWQVGVHYVGLHLEASRCRENRVCWTAL